MIDDAEMNMTPSREMLLLSGCVALIILLFLFSHDAGQFSVLYLRLLKTIAKRLNYKHGSVLVFQNEAIVKLKQGAKKNN